MGSLFRSPHSAVPFAEGEFEVVDGRLRDADITILHSRSIAENVRFERDGVPYTGTITLVDGTLEGRPDGARRIAAPDRRRRDRHSGSRLRKPGERNQGTAEVTCGGRTNREVDPATGVYAALGGIAFIAC